EASVSLKRNSEGEPIGFRGIIRDITDRKRMEEALQQREQDYLALLETTFEGIVVVDAETLKVVYGNRRASKMFGFDPILKDGVGINILDFVHPEDKEEVIKGFTEDLYQEERRQRYEVRAKTKDGGELWITALGTRTEFQGRLAVLLSTIDVTERRGAEEALRASEEKFRRLVEEMNDGYCVLQGSKVVFANARSAEVFGYEQEEVMGKTVQELLPAEIVDELSKMRAKRQRGEAVPQHYETILVGKEGTTRPVELGTRVIEYAGIIGYQGIIRDITERKVKQKEYQSIIHTTTDGFWIVDNKGRFLDVNNAYCALTGYSREELLNMSIPDIEAVETLEYTDRHIQQIIKTGHARFETRHRCKDGRILDIEISTTYAGAGDDRFFVFARDITERKRAEETLKQSAKNYRDLFNNATDAIYIQDKEGHFLNVNQGAVDMYDYPKEFFIGKTPEFLSAPGKNDMKKIIEFVQDAFSGKPRQYDFWGIRKSGEVFPKIVRSQKGIYLDKEAVITFALDITERKKAEEKLKNTLAELQKLKDQIEKENIYLKEEIKLEHNFGEIVGQSNSLKKMFNQVELVSRTDTSVLILGETGTGKELVARAIHGLSNRKDRPLVKVNCSALPKELIESELFGHVKGAFTGAIERKIGRFELADKGTIFLDEIVDLPLNLQSRLLRVLQENEFERIGSSTTIKVDVRVIAATNRNLEKLVLDGEFRQDLYYRLNVFPITCPSLRERNDDIPFLVNHFVNKYSPKMGKRIKTVPQNVIKSLQNYHWPGNVRELENVIERAMVINQGDRLHIGDWFIQSPLALESMAIPSLREYEKDYIIRVLEKTNWRIRGKNGAAQILGLQPTTLESRMQKLEIKRQVIASEMSD
ncbi:MAG: PAS domain S-box protein, partial [Desulfobacteraceae bacterium]|nr:PAS domain S-box protein [Desulfobacteraceae bacterium]